MLTEDLSERLIQFAGTGSEPLAVGFSGGGDSTALLHLLLNALKGQRRDVHALIVDHKLRRGSSTEAKLAADRARAMGAQPTVLKWIHDKPTTGIQEKARHARYELMGDMCRKLGVTKLFLGHNEDDQAETVWMRESKGSGWRGLSGMRDRVSAPIWPALMGIEIVRPLLCESRLDLRNYNVENELEFIDDPSNENRSFERIRARDALLLAPDGKQRALDIGEQSQNRLRKEFKTCEKLISEHCDILDWGGAWLKPSALDVHQDDLVAMLRYLIPCISGQGEFPPTSRLYRHIRSIKAGFTAGTTLGGARLLSREKGISVVRDTGMVLGRNQRPPLKPLKLMPDQPAIWDGRFMMRTSKSDIEIVALGQVEGRPEKKTKKALKIIPLAARKTIPVFCSGRELINIPFLESDESFFAKSLFSERLDGFLKSI